MAQVGSASGNQNGEVRKGEWQRTTFKPTEWDSAWLGKKAKNGELPNGEIEKGMTSAHPEIGNQPRTFKGIKAEKKGRVKNRETNLLSDRHGTCFVNHKTKQGNQWFPWDSRISL